MAGAIDASGGADHNSSSSGKKRTGRSPDELDFSQITARAGGGEIIGRFTLLPQTEDSPFTVSIQFHDVQADRLVADAGGTRGMITGRLEGHLDASGTTADQNALA